MSQDYKLEIILPRDVFKSLQPYLKITGDLNCGVFVLNSMLSAFSDHGEGNNPAKDISVTDAGPMIRITPDEQRGIYYRYILNLTGHLATAVENLCGPAPTDGSPNRLVNIEWLTNVVEDHKRMIDLRPDIIAVCHRIRAGHDLG